MARAFSVSFKKVRSSMLPSVRIFTHRHVVALVVASAEHRKRTSLHSFRTESTVVETTFRSWLKAMDISIIGDDFISTRSALERSKSMLFNIFGVQFSNADTFRPWLSRRAGSM